MLGIGSASGFVNSLGDVPVAINSGFQNLGTNPAGKQILGQFRQYFDVSDKNFIEMEFKTADGSPLVPVGTTVGGQTVFAYGWEIGATDAIDWYDFWDYVEVPANGALATLNGLGAPSSINHTAELVGPLGGQWSGVDTDNMLLPLGDLFNRVRIRYEVVPVPAPSALAALGLSLGLATRRRRA
jgi:hypothetical protein